MARRAALRDLARSAPRKLIAASIIVFQINQVAFVCESNPREGAVRSLTIRKGEFRTGRDAFRGLGGIQFEVRECEFLGIICSGKVARSTTTIGEQVKKTRRPNFFYRAIDNSSRLQNKATLATRAKFTASG
jgi:hypothetical protein